MFCTGRILAFAIALVLLLTISANAETWKELLEQSDSLYQASEYDSAIVIGEMALEKAIQQFGEMDTATALVFHRMGNYHYAKADYDQAESLYNQAVAIRSNVLGPEHPEVAKTLSNLGNLCKIQGRYVEAESLYQKSLRIEEKALGPEHPDLTYPMRGLARLYSYQGRFSEAEPLHKRAVTINEKAYGPDHLKVALSLQNLAFHYIWTYRSLKAEPLCKRALSIREKVLPPDHPVVASALNCLGIVYRDLGRFAESEAYRKKTLEIWEKAYGPEHPDVAVALFNLTGFFYGLGKYAEAEPMIKRAIAIWEKTKGTEHADWAAGLRGLADTYAAEGRYDEAEPLYLKSLEVMEKALGPVNPDVALIVDNLADLYLIQGRYAEAEKLYKRSLPAREKSLGEDSPEVAHSLKGLANLYREEGKYAQAEPLYRRALGIWDKALTPENPDRGYGMIGLATLRRNQARYAEAESLYQTTLQLWQGALGPAHPLVAECLESFSGLCRLTGDLERGLEQAQRAFRIREGNFRENGCVLSEKDALSYAHKVRASADNYFSCYFDAASDRSGLTGKTGGVVFASKGQVSDNIFELRRSLIDETDPDVVALAESLRYARFRLSELFVEGPGDDTAGAYLRELDSLGNLAEEFEARLARRSASFRKRQDYRNVSVDRVASFLPQNSVLVEYLKYDYYQLQPDQTIPRYLVVILDVDQNLRVINLGEASQIEVLISEYREHMLKVSSQDHMPLDRDKDEYEKIARKLYDALWQPVEGYTAGKNLVLIAPDGGLNLISFAGLINDQGKYLIEKYPIHYLSSGRDLIRLKDRQIGGQGLLAMGDPDYDATVEARLSAPGTIVYAAVADEDKYRTRNVRSGCGDLSQLHVKPLRYTQNEIKKVTERWSGLGADSAVTFLGPQASEDNFKTQAPGKKVIHLSTHGYFYEGHCKPDVQHSGSELSRKFIGENPLLLSGLLFAGSNLHGAGADSAGLEDGVLSAYEVSAMDLEGTDLVVLSACETGLGEVKEGEGVYGLRRAFQMAGARTVVSALWPVSDEITAEMMGQLYSQSKKLLPQRIRETQLNQIQKLRSHGFPDHPYNWAAFIALGGWR